MLNQMGNFMGQDKTDLPGDDYNTAASGVDDAVQQQAGQAPETGGAQPDDAQQQAAEDGAVLEDVTALREALHKAEADAESAHEQMLRLSAETDNIRKRAQRDVDSARKFALEKFATELLGVRDSLEMGLKASEEEQADSAKLAEGMELTSRMLAGAMEKFGVEVVNPEGETFDPEVHEAVSMQETDAQAPNTVVAVVQKGYMLNGRVLRAAMVVVAKAPSGAA